MKTISLQKYRPIISDKQIGDEIYTNINKELATNEQIIIDLNEIKSMATFCAKQIFGRLYLEQGPTNFFNNILLKNATDDVKTIIRIGIQNALEEREPV